MNFIAGHRGMVGSAVVRLFEKEGLPTLTRTRQELDLLDQKATLEFFAQEKPEKLIVCAARVGGILANAQDRAGFLYENLTIQNNLLHAVAKTNVKRVIFLGSSCIYPKEAPQPIPESALLTGPLEPTNEGYAIAKIAGIKLLQYFREQKKLQGLSLMPCNLYGTNDNYDLQSSHVLPAFVRKFCEAKDTVTVWGSGKPKREFMHVDDLARAILHFLNRDVEEHWINIGWGEDISIKELADLIAKEAGFTGTIEWDASKPDGTMRKCQDVGLMRSYGFEPQISLEEGIQRTIQEWKHG